LWLMPSKYILSLDLGTTGNRAILFNKKGEAVVSVYREFKQYYPKPGWVEHDPLEIWQSVLFVLRGVVKKARIKSEEIAGIGLTNQRETTVVWNGKTGKPIYRAVVWQDRRTADTCERLKRRGHETMIRQKTGLLLNPYFSATKIEWILRNFPSPHGRGEGEGRLFGTIDTWILWNLTGGKVHATDVSNASRTMLWNIKTCEWDDELLRLFKVPKEILPEVLPSSGKFGALDQKILGAAIPITGVCGDQQSALFGQQCFNRGEAKITYGTGAFLLLNTGDRPVDTKNSLITTVAWQIGNEITYALEGSVFACGALINWLQKNLQLVKDGPDASRLAATVSDSGGVYIVPALAGLGAPHWRSDVRGLIAGLTQFTNREHIARAALEAIAYQVEDIFVVMRQVSKFPLRLVRVDGGVAKSDFVLQFQADISGLIIERADSVEATARGAAYLAGLGVGFWRDIKEIQQQAQLGKKFKQKMSAQRRGELLKGWQAAMQKVLHENKQ